MSHGRSVAIEAATKFACACLLSCLVATDIVWSAQAAKERRAAIRKRVVAHIEELKDEDENGRCRAAFALGLLGRAAEVAVPALIGALKDEDREVRRNAAEALGQIGPAAVPALIKALKGQDGIPRLGAAEALGKIGPAAVPALIEALKGQDGVSRLGAAEALGKIGPAAEAAVPALIEALKDRDMWVRWAGAKALGQIGPAVGASVPALIGALKDEDMEVRVGAAMALGQIGPAAKASVPALIEALKGEDVFVHNHAAEALGQIGPDAKAAVPALIEALKDEDMYVRRNAAEALGQIGPDAKAPVPALIDALKDEDEEVRLSAAEALAKLATALLNKEATEAIGDLKKAERVLLGKEAFADSVTAVSAAVKGLQAMDRANLITRAWNFLCERKWLLSIAIYIVSAFAFSLALLFCWPLRLLRLNERLEPLVKFKLAGIADLEFRTKFNYVLLTGFFHYHRRVLDAWVAEHIEDARERFASKRTVQERSVYVPVPIRRDGEPIAAPAGKDFHSLFAGNIARLLIWGEGGCGKTSLACRFATWAMSDQEEDRLCRRHPMIPVLLDHDLDTNVPEGDDVFLHAVRGGLQDVAGPEEPPTQELTRRLLRGRRVLVIVDGLSELTKDTQGLIRPMAPDFVANALVVTSRANEDLDGADHAKIEPLRVEGNRLSSFMDAYLTQSHMRDEFEDGEFLDARARLSRMVGDRDITVLIAKLYAEQLIAKKKGLEDAQLPDSLPDLMLRYLNEINRGSGPGDPDNATVHSTAKLVAWECLKATFQPTPAKRQEALKALGDDRPEVRLAYLEERLKMVQKAGVSGDEIRFCLDPLAEYLAGLHMLDLYKGNPKLWRQFLTRADNVSGAPKAIQGFLLALLDCCRGTGGEINLPDFLEEELAKRAGLDPDAVERAHLELRVKRLAASLSLPDVDDRRAAAEALATIGPEARAAVPALAEALKDDDAILRAHAGRALGKLDADTRTGVGLRDDGLPDILWRSVPGGTLMMGSSKDDEDAESEEYGPEGKPFPVPVDAFQLAAYPVTNTQFRPFVEDDGYVNRDYWTEAGWQWREEAKPAEPSLWRDSQWNLPNHPMVGVTWYEVCAYCQWLTARLQQAGELAPEESIRLPTEAEWEWTAKGPDQHKYPWGNDWIKNPCNCDEAGIGQTCAVGMFPGDVSQWLKDNGQAVHDLGGNVSEWCLTQWRSSYEQEPDDGPEGESPPVWRGGTYDDERQRVRCSCRDWYDPDDEDDDIGFRCAWSLSSSPDSCFLNPDGSHRRWLPRKSRRGSAV